MYNMLIKAKGVRYARENRGTKTRTENYMDKFVRVEIRMTAEQREEVQAHAEAQGESTNGFINRAISETMERDGKPKTD